LHAGELIPGLPGLIILLIYSFQQHNDLAPALMLIAGCLVIGMLLACLNNVEGKLPQGQSKDNDYAISF
jgi:hypothetical protein